MKVFYNPRTPEFLLDFYEISMKKHYSYHIRQILPETEELIKKGMVVFEEKHRGSWTGLRLTFKGFWYAWQIKHGYIK